MGMHCGVLYLDDQSTAVVLVSARSPELRENTELEVKHVRK